MNNDWRWVVGAPANTPCPGCRKPLRSDSGAGIVEWNANQWHTHCLIDNLVKVAAEHTGCGHMLVYHGIGG